MPLLLSPIDGSPMRQIHRYGIELDVCPTSGGVWLDRGELDKLIAFIQQEVAGEQMMAPPPMQSQPRYKKDDDWDDDDYRRYKDKGYYGSGKYHKKGKMSKIMDLLDF